LISEKRKLEHNSKPGLNLKHPSSRTVLQNLNVPPHKQKEGLTRSTIDKLKPHVDPSKLAPSGLINKLAALSKRPPTEDAPINLPRSSAFTEKAKPPPPSETSIPRSIETECNAPKRDDRLALIEDLEIGPYNHVAPFDDPGFEQLEPNSGIRLTYVSRFFEATQTSNWWEQTGLVLFHTTTLKNTSVAVTISLHLVFIR